MRKRQMNKALDLRIANIFLLYNKESVEDSGRMPKKADRHDFIIDTWWGSQYSEWEPVEVQNLRSKFSYAVISKNPRPRAKRCRRMFRLLSINYLRKPRKKSEWDAAL